MTGNGIAFPWGYLDHGDHPNSVGGVKPAKTMMALETIILISVTTLFGETASSPNWSSWPGASILIDLAGHVLLMQQICNFDVWIHGVCFQTDQYIMQSKYIQLHGYDEVHCYFFRNFIIR